MKPIKVTDKLDREYTIQFKMDTYKNEPVNNHPKWQVEHVVIDGQGNQIGFGHVAASCRADHEHLPEEEILTALRFLAAGSIQEDIREEKEIESKGYNFNAWDCTK